MSRAEHVACTPSLRDLARAAAAHRRKQTDIHWLPWGGYLIDRMHWSRVDDAMAWHRSACQFARQQQEARHESGLCWMPCLDDARWITDRFGNCVDLCAWYLGRSGNALVVAFPWETDWLSSAERRRDLPRQIRLAKALFDHADPTNVWATIIETEGGRIVRDLCEYETASKRRVRERAQRLRWDMRQVVGEGVSA